MPQPKRALNLTDRFTTRFLQADCLTLEFFIVSFFVVILLAPYYDSMVAKETTYDSILLEVSPSFRNFCRHELSD